MIDIKECECQLLGAWLLGYHKDHIKDFSYFSVYCDVFKAIRGSEKIDMVTVANKANCSIVEIANITSQYMPSLYESAYKFIRQYQIRNMLEALKNSPDDIVTQIDRINKEIEKLSNTEIKQPAELSKLYWSEIENRLMADESIKYGIPRLDYITGGIRGEELTVIAARPSIGKTAFALQIAFKAALKGKNVLFFPLEMSATQLVERLVCKDTDIVHEHLKAPGKMSKDEYDKLETWLSAFKRIERNLKVIENVGYLSDIEKYIEYYKSDFIVIDQLTQLKEYKHFNSIRERFSHMTSTCKTLTMKHKKPIILLAQINRDSQGRVPTLADLKESGSIEEDADNVIMLHQNGEMDHDFKVPMQILVRKQRNGQKDVVIDAIYQSDKFSLREEM
ncbi:AAA family ATPase [Aminipila butyrica]|uniref:AAA family ATPase n=1 Tax=Aminipila butyrica TaxID=433296 RepID=A0A858BRZ2_9FIRM|nr:DnaB-like helicase C-terminal domain-containing protein [Aminipila butyrica]QIB67818.1 AAA family ATPase [Aminipila butyrica]